VTCVVSQSNSIFELLPVDCILKLFELVIISVVPFEFELIFMFVEPFVNLNLLALEAFDVKPTLKVFEKKLF